MRVSLRAASVRVLQLKTFTAKNIIAFLIFMHEVVHPECLKYAPLFIFVENLKLYFLAKTVKTWENRPYNFKPVQPIFDFALVALLTKIWYVNLDIFCKESLFPIRQRAHFCDFQGWVWRASSWP